MLALVLCTAVIALYKQHTMGEKKNDGNSYEKSIKNTRAL